MTLRRGSDAIGHRTFADLPVLLRPGDLLVLNDTKVIRGRLSARKETGAAVEILLLAPAGAGEEREGGRTWEALARPSKRLREGMTFRFGSGLSARLVSRLGAGRWNVLLEAPGDVASAIDREGEVPLPPYIRRERGDRRKSLDALRYQTVYAAVPGSVAAPTAGLHFDRGMLADLAGAGVCVAAVTLAVGYGTFQPIRTEDVEAFEIHPESYRLSPETAAAVAAARERGGRVVAVGTTSVRVLETCAAENGLVAAGRGTTRLFIHPGYSFRVVDAMLTNFHLPRSSLLALVMAFAGPDTVRRAYAAAVAGGYRFYSYGDAMFIG